MPSPRELFHQDFTNHKDGSLGLAVSFMRRDRKMEGVLLSEENDAEFRLTVDGGWGFVTGLQNPLARIPPTERMLLTANSGSELAPGRLLVLMHRNQYPRAELTVIRLIRE
jgi:hypothetical protein